MCANFAGIPLKERTLILENLKRIADATRCLMGKKCEVTIHDFTNLDASIIYIQGDVTGRKVGAPVSTRLFKLLKEHGDDIEDQFNYRLRTRSGRIIRSSTTFIRDEKDRVLGCYCINYDVTDLLNIRDMLNEFSYFSNEPQEKEAKTVFPEASMEEFVDGIIEQAIAGIGKQPAFMRKVERLEVVRMLELYGAFKLRGSVEYVAKILGVSRFSIYNYINENNRLQG